MALTPAQKQNRLAKLGSSDAPVVAGVSPYKGPATLYYQIHGELPRYTDEETYDQFLGSKLEPVIAELTAKELGIKIRRSPPRTHPRYPFMTANLDYEIVKHARGPGVLEIKRRQGKPFHALPEDILLQTAHQMAVTNREWGIVAVQFGWGKPVPFEIERDKEVEEYLIEIEAKFMLRVERGEPPDSTWDKDALSLMKALYPRDSGEAIILPAQAEEICHQFLTTKSQADQETHYKAHCEAQLKSMMGAASTAECGPYRLSWKRARDGKSFDEEKFAQEHPQVYAAYQTTRLGARRFSVKRKDTANE